MLLRELAYKSSGGFIFRRGDEYGNEIRIILTQEAFKRVMHSRMRSGDGYDERRLRPKIVGWKPRKFVSLAISQNCEPFAGVPQKKEQRALQKHQAGDQNDHRSCPVDTSSGGAQSSGARGTSIRRFPLSLISMPFLSRMIPSTESADTIRPLKRCPE